MGMQTQIYFTDEESLKAHQAWARYLDAIKKEGSQVTLGEFIKKLFFSVIENSEEFEKFLEKVKPKEQSKEESEQPKK